MFIDKAKVRVISGSGGNGMVAWRREKYEDMGGPAGGDGGKGGSVMLQIDESLSTLLDFKYKSIFQADCGENGRSKNQHGKNGQNLVIKVPCGTIVKDPVNNKIIGDLISPGQTLIVAQGGRGGRGNSRFISSTRQAPQFCEPGEPGIERELELELKLIADVGLCGMPNAGKSTLISVISAAKPKIADYPFTTLAPNLGVIKKSDGDGFVVADIPGLIEGASEGIGLGHEFLRHVERTRFLLHLVDLTEENPISNYKIINEELQKYGSRLSDIKQVVVLNKADAIPEEEALKIKAEFEQFSSDVHIISAVSRKGVSELVGYVTKLVDEIPQPELKVEVEEDFVAHDNDDSSFAIYKEKKAFIVAGGKVERLVSVTDSRNTEQMFRLQNILTAMGVFEALKESGIQEGDTVKIGHIEFEYYS